MAYTGILAPKVVVLGPRCFVVQTGRDVPRRRSCLVQARAPKPSTRNVSFSSRLNCFALAVGSPRKATPALYYPAQTDYPPPTPRSSPTRIDPRAKMLGRANVCSYTACPVTFHTIPRTRSDQARAGWLSPGTISLSCISATCWTDQSRSHLEFQQQPNKKNEPLALPFSPAYAT